MSIERFDHSVGSRRIVFFVEIVEHHGSGWEGLLGGGEGPLELEFFSLLLLVVGLGLAPELRVRVLSGTLEVQFALWDVDWTDHGTTSEAVLLLETKF